MTPEGIVNLFVRLPEPKNPSNIVATFSDDADPSTKVDLELRLDEGTHVSQIHIWARLDEVLKHIKAPESEMRVLRLEVDGVVAKNEISVERKRSDNTIHLTRLKSDLSFTSNGADFAVRIKPAPARIYLNSISYPSDYLYLFSLVGGAKGSTLVARIRDTDIEVKYRGSDESDGALFCMSELDFLEAYLKVEASPIYLDMHLESNGRIFPIEFPSLDIRDFHTAYHILSRQFHNGNDLLKVKPFASKKGKLTFRISVVDQLGAVS